MGGICPCRCLEAWLDSRRAKPWQMKGAKAQHTVSTAVPPNERDLRQLSAAQAFMLAMASDNLVTGCRPLLLERLLLH